ncbi:MAG: hypothetical protein HRU72_11030 [Planctomycetia bacterium]|nr:hypothetical protein [Candidatus Brocadia sp.]QOJ07035.1 MAG: hypothetical protein HRU72_11030 [Planctomycetia bacterium]
MDISSGRNKLLAETKSFASSELVRRANNKAGKGHWIGCERRFEQQRKLG